MQPIEYTYGEYCKRWIRGEVIAMLLLVVLEIVLPLYVILFISHKFFIILAAIILGWECIRSIRYDLRGYKNIILVACSESTVIFRIDEYGIFVHRVVLDLSYEELFSHETYLNDIVQPVRYQSMIKGISITTGCYVPWKDIKHIYYHGFVSKNWIAPTRIFWGPFLRVCEKKKKEKGLIVNLGSMPLNYIRRRQLRKAIRYFSGDKDILSNKLNYQF